MRGFIVTGYDWSLAIPAWDDKGERFIQRKYPVGKLLVRTGSGFVGCPVTGDRSMCVIYRNLTADELLMFQMLYPELNLEA